MYFDLTLRPTDGQSIRCLTPLQKGEGYTLAYNSLYSYLLSRTSSFCSRQATVDPTETVQALMDAIQAGDFEKAQSLLSGDFFSGGSMICMILSSPWMGLGEKLKAAFPDLDYGLRIERVDGNIVKFSTQIYGMHTRDLELPMLTIRRIPATNKSIATAREYGIAVVRAGKVISWAMESIHCANLTTILEQLGVNGRWQLAF